MFNIKPRISYQQPIASKLTERFVYNQNELLAAIDDAVADSSVAFSPRKITLAGSMSFSQTIILPSVCQGLTIESSSYAIIRASVPLAALFSMQGQQQNIKNVNARVDFPNGIAIGTFVQVDGNGLLCEISGNRTVGIPKFIGVSAGGAPIIQLGTIANNSIVPYVAGDVITGAITSSAIYGNKIGLSGCGFTFGTFSIGNSITGNAFIINGYINTSAGSRNTVTGNARVPTVTLSGTCVAAGNSA